MTGTGTQQNPYIPENWNELKTAAETADVYIRLPESAVWDMNAQHPQDAPGISIRCTEIDGNGSTISKLRKASGVVFTMDTSHSVTIKDLDFEKMYITGAKVFSAIGYYDAASIILDNIGIGGELYDSDFWYSDLRGIKTNGCAIDLELSNSTIDDNGKELLDTKITLNGTVASGIGTLLLNSSALYGSISALNHHGILNLNGSLSVVDISLQDFTQVNYYGSGTTMLLNISKTGSATITGAFVKVAEAHMTDADYINAAGFPCGAETED